MANRPPPVKKRSLYEVLGVERDANPIDLGVAFKRRLAELERSPQADDGEANLVREAYRILNSPKDRAAHDASLVTRDEKAAAAAQETPDLVLEADPEPPKGKRNVGLAVGGALVALVLAWLVLRPGTAPVTSPAPAPVAVAPKPAPPPAPPKKLGPAEVIGLASRSVVRIQAYDMSGRTITAGSGVVVAPGTIVTTCQGLPPNAQLVARIGQEDHPARLELIDEELNLCRLAASEARAVLAVAAEEVNTGDEVHAVAVHKGDAISLVSTRVKAVRTRGERRDYELETAITPSAAGGALFDAYGRFVGVLTSRESGAVSASAIARMRTRGGAVTK